MISSKSIASYDAFGKYGCKADFIITLFSRCPQSSTHNIINIILVYIYNLLVMKEDTDTQYLQVQCINESILYVFIMTVCLFTVDPVR